MHLAGLGDDVAAAHRTPLVVRGHAAGHEDQAAGADDVSEVADGLGHSRNADLLPAIESWHGTPPWSVESPAIFLSRSPAVKPKRRYA